MQIDWLTVAAQILNFLVLVWLLQRFLYRPITEAMRRREDRIEERLAEARTAREDAESEAQRLRHEQDALEDRKEEILDDARSEADALGKRLEADLREEMEEKRRAWQAHLAEEREEFLKSLRKQAGHQLVAITGQVLGDLAGSDLADHVAATFATRLTGLDTERREKLRAAARDGDAPALVETGAGLGPAGKRRITRAIHETVAEGLDVEYRENADLVTGIRLLIGDQTVEWSARRYLARLETQLDEVIEAGGGHPDTAARPEASPA